MWYNVNRGQRGCTTSLFKSPEPYPQGFTLNKNSDKENLKMEEVWKDIKDYEGLYQVSNFGRIRSYPNFSHKDFFILKQWITQGYYYVKLFKDGKRKSYSVHRLVAEAFIPNPYNLPQVGHKDENNFKTGDGCNNCVDNLEWCTAKENANMPKRKDRTFGENNPFYGLHHTEETRKRMSKKKKRREPSYVWQTSP